MRPYGPSSRLSSEPLHDRISIEDLSTRCARSEATTSYSARTQSSPLRRSGAPPENQLSQEDHPHTGRSLADEHELVGSALDIDSFDKGERQQQEVKVEQEENEANDADDEQRQGMNDIAAVVMTERVSDTYLSGKEDGTSRPAERQRSLPSRDPSPESSHNEAGSRNDSYSDDGLNNKAYPDENDEKPRPAKRKRLSSSYDDSTHKKRKHHLQQKSTRQSKSRFKFYRHSFKSYSVLDQSSRVVIEFSAEDRLPSPASSASQAMNTEMPSDCSDLEGSFRSSLPTLIEVIFRSQSPHYCSFTAAIWDGCDGRGVSFGQLARLIESTGHVGNIDDCTIKPTKQHLFLVTGFRRHASSRLSSSGTTVSTAGEISPIHRDATRIRPQHGKALVVEALASQGSKPSSSDDDGGLSDSDPDSSGDDDGCSSEDEQRRSHTSKHSR